MADRFAIHLCGPPGSNSSYAEGRKLVAEASCLSEAIIEAVAAGLDTDPGAGTIQDRLTGDEFSVAEARKKLST